MKIIVEAADLFSAVTWATKTYDNKDNKAYVALEVQDGAVIIRHLNEGAYLSSPLVVSSIDSDENVSIALDGQTLQKLAAPLNRMGTAITLEIDLTKKTSPVIVKNATSRFTIPTIKTAIATKPNFTKVAEVNDTQYFSAISKLSKLCSPTSASSGAGTESVSIRFGAERITLMATDSYALGEVVIDSDVVEDFEKILGGAVILLPQSFANAVAASKDAEGAVEIVYDTSSKKFGYRYTDGRVAVFGLDQAIPLEYAAMKENILNQMNKSVRFGTADFKKAVETVASLSVDDTDILVSISREKEFVAVSDSKGQNRIVVTGEESGDDEIVMSFMTHTIKSALNPISSATLQFSFVSSEIPCVLRPVLDTGEPNDDIFSMAVANRN